MTQGTKFGRRNERGQSAGAGAGRASQPTAPASPASPATPEPTDEALVDPITKAMHYSASAVGLVVAGLMGAWIMLPMKAPVAQSPDRQIEAQQNRAIEDGATLDTGVDAADKPELKQASTTGKVKAGAAGENDLKRTAALKFFGFYHLAGRARADYCGKLGVDMAGYTRKLQQSQSRYYARAVQVASVAGLTEDKIYADSQVELAELVAKDMEKVGTQTGLGPAGGCQMMASHADRLLSSIDFAKLMPDEHRTLMGL